MFNLSNKRKKFLDKRAATLLGFFRKCSPGSIYHNIKTIDEIELVEESHIKFFEETNASSFNKTKKDLKPMIVLKKGDKLTLLAGCSTYIFYQYQKLLNTDANIFANVRVIVVDHNLLGINIENRYDFLNLLEMKADIFDRSFVGCVPVNLNRIMINKKFRKTTHKLADRVLEMKSHLLYNAGQLKPIILNHSGVLVDGYIELLALKELKKDGYEFNKVYVSFEAPFRELNFNVLVNLENVYATTGLFNFDCIIKYDETLKKEQSGTSSKIEYDLNEEAQFETDEKVSLRPLELVSKDSPKVNINIKSYRNMNMDIYNSMKSECEDKIKRCKQGMIDLIAAEGAIMSSAERYSQFQQLEMEEFRLYAELNMIKNLILSVPSISTKH